MEAGLFTLLGVVVGSFLTYLLGRSVQQEQWRRDCRRQEFRELVSTITSCMVDVIAFKKAREMSAPWTEKLLNGLIETHTSAYKVIGDRIFIAKDVERIDAGSRFLAGMDRLRKSEGENDDVEVLATLLEEIVMIARNG